MARCDDPNDLLLLTEEMLLMAEECRQDPSSFFEFVLEEEHTRAPISIAPHQKILMDFVAAHPRCVIMLPVGHSKTFTLGGLAMWELGRNPSMRGAIVSATQMQAEKPLGMVRDYIEKSARLKMVFPHLARSLNPHDSWSQSQITIERPFGIRDASLYAVGFGGALQGSRLSWIMVDDLLDEENTATNDMRQKVYAWFMRTVRSRLDPKNGRVCVINTAWHPEDYVHRLIQEGWPALIMRINGDIEIKNTDWDTDDVRPMSPNPLVLGPAGTPPCRLVAHDPDPGNVMRLWPERFPDQAVAELRRDYAPAYFNQMYMNLCRDDDTSMCKQEFIDKAMRLARAEGITSMVHEYRGPNLTFTGLDLAISPGEEHDDTAFFTFEARPDGTKVILDLDVGQWDGPKILDKLFDKQARYNSIVRVENNGAQDFIRQFALSRNRSLPVKAHTTNRAKAHPEHGIPGIFLEMANGAWLIPNRGGECHPALQRFIEACLYYVPQRHVDDTLMAAYFARAQAKEWGVLGPQNNPNPTGPQQGGIGMQIMSR